MGKNSVNNVCISIPNCHFGNTFKILVCFQAFLLIEFHYICKKKLVVRGTEKSLLFTIKMKTRIDPPWIS